MQKLIIKTEFIKLDSLLKFCGIAQTGGHAKSMVLDGEVLVNGEICTMRGKKIRKGDIIKVGDKELEVIQGEN